MSADYFANLQFHNNGSSILLEDLRFRKKKKKTPICWLAFGVLLPLTSTNACKSQPGSQRACSGEGSMYTRRVEFQVCYKLLASSSVLRQVALHARRHSLRLCGHVLARSIPEINCMAGSLEASQSLCSGPRTCAHLLQLPALPVRESVIVYKYLKTSGMDI